MKWVILRDDDTNALTSPEDLDRLYRPFLDRGLPVSLAVIPHVRTDITYGQNILEGFLATRNCAGEKTLPIGTNQELVKYLLQNPGYEIVQHGYSHEFIDGDCEFEQNHRADLVRRIEGGKRLLAEAGFSPSETFVAPYDRFTRTSFCEVAKRFRVISAAWFEWGRLPYAWWPRHLLQKLAGRAHWRAGRTILLSHPRCFLSRRRPYATMLDEIKKAIAAQPLAVLVTHWWEFFHQGCPDERFIQVLHELAGFLAEARDLRVVRFQDVADGRVSLNYGSSPAEKSQG